jgi:hypothetical protein
VRCKIGCIVSKNKSDGNYEICIKQEPTTQEVKVQIEDGDVRPTPQVILTETISEYRERRDTLVTSVE